MTIRLTAKRTPVAEVETLQTELENAVAEGSVVYGTPSGLFLRTLQSLMLQSNHLFSGATSAYARAVTHTVIGAYWQALQRMYGASLALPVLGSSPETILTLDETSSMLARGLGRLAAQYDPVLAGYWIGETYTQLVPADFRTQYGVFYTPPALTNRLLALAANAGVDWGSARVLDPACGGGAFLAPVAQKMRAALHGEPAAKILKHISRSLRGFELDSFSAWMSQTLLEATLYELCVEAGVRLPNVVEACDALETPLRAPEQDLVIGNPPFGRVTLSENQRTRYQRSVYGHANLYGLFMDLAVHLTRPGGVIAYITPTSFLGGMYFRNLRVLMANEAPPVAIDFVSSRKGVFTDVLQETLLATYQRSAPKRPAEIHVATLLSESEFEVAATGVFSMPDAEFDPWLIPRSTNQTSLIERLRQMPHRLSDYGYQVSTGPLVWNRHKSQLSDIKEPGAFPIIWAESITRDGRFSYRTDKKNHRRFLRPNAGDEWLVARRPCVIVQRTTAKEQHRRLIAAELPAEFIERYGAVSIENHLNMVRPTTPNPKVSLKLLAAILNSRIVDEVFRCMSGSVAVSASELEALPLPPPEALHSVERLLAEGVPPSVIEAAISAQYQMWSSFARFASEPDHIVILRDQPLLENGRIFDLLR